MSDEAKMKHIVVLDPEIALTSERFRQRFGPPDLPLAHGELLVQLLRPYPDVKVVLYGPAVAHFGLDVVRDWLPLPLDVRVLEIGPNAAYANSADAVEAICKHEKTFVLLVIDIDSALSLVLPPHQLVVVNLRYGIGEPSIEAGDGWFRLIYDLCEQIQKHADEKGLNLLALQVKEKFGGLRFYIRGADEHIGALIDEAERKSFTICEVCGEPGERRTSCGWV